jgi:hypothetical protein
MEHLLKIQCVAPWLNMHILASTSVAFTRTTVQVWKTQLNCTRTCTTLTSLIFLFFKGFEPGDV